MFKVLKNVSTVLGNLSDSAVNASVAIRDVSEVLEDSVQLMSTTVNNAIIETAAKQEKALEGNEDLRKKMEARRAARQARYEEADK